MIRPVPVAVVLGARNLGGAVLDHYLSLGGAARRSRRAPTRSSASGRAGRSRSRPTPPTPASSPARSSAPASELGGLDLVVNAVSAARPPAGGGLRGRADRRGHLEGYRGWGAAVAEQAFVFLNAGAKALREAGGGALIQVTGGSARRAMPGRGIWASGTRRCARSPTPPRRSCARRASTSRC